MKTVFEHLELSKSVASQFEGTAFYSIRANRSGITLQGDYEYSLFRKILLKYPKSQCRVGRDGVISEIKACIDNTEVSFVLTE